MGHCHMIRFSLCVWAGLLQKDIVFPVPQIRRMSVCLIPGDLLPSLYSGGGCTFSLRKVVFFSNVINMHIMGDNLRVRNINFQFHQTFIHQCYHLLMILVASIIIMMTAKGLLSDFTIVLFSRK